ncbi:MAG: shikimate kinase, partial [Pseudoxanthomonas sp.]
MNPAPNLILVGPMGAGKTSIGRRLAERFGLEFADVDQAVVERCGATINTIFEHVGETGFREREKAALTQLLAQEGKLVSTGGGAVLDYDNRLLMQKRGFVVYLRVGVEAQLKRLGRDRAR